MIVLSLSLFLTDYRRQQDREVSLKDLEKILVSVIVYLSISQMEQLSTSRSSPSKNNYDAPLLFGVVVVGFERKSTLAFICLGIRQFF
jgi:hypothetical protein